MTTLNKFLICPIGASGSGKSTISKELIKANSNIKIFSFDTLRLEWYDPNDYAKAWKMSTEDKQFGEKTNKYFIELVKSGQSIFVDNTNLTPKRRKFYIQESVKNGYKTIGFTFNEVSLETLIERQSTRGDKCVPEGAVRQQYNSMVPPQFDEFDISTTNILLLEQIKQGKFN